MRTFHNLFIVSAFLLLFSTYSCTSFRWYQMGAQERENTTDNCIRIASKDMEVTYDYWSAGGIPAVRILNTSSDTIQLDWEKSFFNINQKAFACYITPPIPMSVEILPPMMEPTQSLAPGAWIDFEGYPMDVAWNYYRKRFKNGKFTPENTHLKSGLQVHYYRNELALVANFDTYLQASKKINRSRMRTLEKVEASNCDQFYIPKDLTNRYNFWWALAEGLLWVFI